MRIHIDPNNTYNFTEDLIYSALNIIRGAFTEVWVDTQLRLIQKRGGSFMLFDAHPLSKSIHAGFASDQGHILELAYCLKQFAYDSGITEAIKQMKDAASYENILLELVIAVHIKAMGIPVMLKPPTLQGRGDVAFAYKNVNYVIECIKFSEDDQEKTMGKIRTYLSDNRKLMDIAIKHRIETMLSVHIKNHLAPDVANRVLADSKKLAVEFAETFQQAREAGDKKQVGVELNNQDYVLLIRQLLYKADPKMSRKERMEQMSKYAINVVDTPEEIIERLAPTMAMSIDYIGTYKKKPILEKIKDSISKKIKQLQLTPDHGRIICIEIPALLGSKPEGIKPIADDAFRSHEGLVAVIVCQRMLGDHMQRGLGIYLYINKSSPLALDDDFFETFGVARDQMDYTKL